MIYSKPAISIQDQIARLKNRGLTITDEQKAVLYLSNISYYRLRAYTHPFQDNTDPDHPFTRQITFEEILSLYIFDGQLRLLVLDAIEIALRTQIIYHWSLSNGSHWHLNQNLYKDRTKFIKHLASLQKEINRSNETFIGHYKKIHQSFRTTVLDEFRN